MPDIDPRRVADTGLDPSSFSDRVRAAIVGRREPHYEPDAQISSGLTDRELAPDLPYAPHEDYRYPLAYPAREMQTVERFRRQAQVTLDGTGAGTADLGSVPENQTWIVERVTARAAGGAAGQALVYAGSGGNDLDLLAVIALAAPAFAGQTDGNSFPILPGTPVVVKFIGAGNGVNATVNFMYAIGVWDRSGFYGDFPGD